MVYSRKPRLHCRSRKGNVESKFFNSELSWTIFYSSKVYGLTYEVINQWRMRSLEVSGLLDNSQSSAGPSALLCFAQASGSENLHSKLLFSYWSSVEVLHVNPVGRRVSKDLSSIRYISDISKQKYWVIWQVLQIFKVKRNFVNLHFSTAEKEWSWMIQISIMVLFCLFCIILVCIVS